MHSLLRLLNGDTGHVDKRTADYSCVPAKLGKRSLQMRNTRNILPRSTATTYCLIRKYACPFEKFVELIYYPTYCIYKSYMIPLTVYSGSRVYCAWPANILDYCPVSDVTYINVTLKYLAILLTIARSRARCPLTS